MFHFGLPDTGQNNNNNNIIIIMLKQPSQDPFMCGTGTKTETIIIYFKTKNWRFFMKVKNCPRLVVIASLDCLQQNRSQ
jgi:hypothetical protein